MQKSGQRVKFYHLRWFWEESFVDHYTRPHEKGGVTIVLRHNEDGSISYGAAWCSIHDNYVRSKGREIALENMKDVPCQCFGANESWPTCKAHRLQAILSHVVWNCQSEKWFKQSPDMLLGMVGFGFVCVT